MPILNAYDGLSFFDQMLHGWHFMLCTFAVLIGCVPLLTEKGTLEHRFAGLIYLPVSMVALLFASYIAWHEASLVLMCFNFFCAYLLMSGWRAVHEEDVPRFIDWLAPIGLLSLSLFVALHALFYDEGMKSFYLFFFAFNGTFLASRDLKNLRTRVYWGKRKLFFADGLFGRPKASEWMGRHIAGMVGSMIANLSVVVLSMLPLALHWLWPLSLTSIGAFIAWKEHKKKQRVRETMASLFKPQFQKKPGPNKKDEDYRRAV